MSDSKYSELIAWADSSQARRIQFDDSLDVPVENYLRSFSRTTGLILVAGEIGGEAYGRIARPFRDYLWSVKQSPEQRQTCPQVRQIQTHFEDAYCRTLGLSESRRGASIIADLCKNDHEENTIPRGIVALMEGVILAAWSSFEILAGDLWEVSMNLRPKVAAAISEPISAVFLQKYQFNLSDKMGTLMRETRAVGFTSLKDIRSAYKSAFSCHATAIQAALDDRSFDALSLARNLIAHKGGRCDDEYKRRATSFPVLPQLELGTYFAVDGELVVKLIEPTIDHAVDLIESVSQWLLNHPSK